MRIRLAAAFLLIGSTVWGQANPPRRVPPQHDLMSYGVVETVPGMDRVAVKEVTYKTAGGQALTMSVYSSPSPAGAQPAVVFVNGVGDRPGGPKLRTWGQYTSWPRLMAASGVVAITFDARVDDANAADIRDAFAYVRDSAATLGIDPARIGAWACSANVRAALPLLMQPEALGAKAAVLYYGSAEVPIVRTDLPILLVRAGKDRPQQNEGIDRLAAQAFSSNAPWTVVNLPGAHHAFDVFDDTEESRTAVRRTVAYLQDRLAPPPNAAAQPPNDARDGAVHLMVGEYAEAEACYTRYVAAHPQDADALVRLANAQVELKKPDEAAANLKKAVALEPGIAEAWAMLGRIEADKKNYPAAVDALQKALTIAPDDAEALYQLGKTRLAQQDAPGAIASLERAVELNPGNGWAWNSLAHAYMVAKQPAKAASSFEHVLPFAPKNPTLLYNTACAYALAGDKTKGIDLLDRAVAEGFKDKAGLMNDPDLASVRADPRFAEIVKRVP